MTSTSLLGREIIKHALSLVGWSGVPCNPRGISRLNLFCQGFFCGAYFVANTLLAHLHLNTVVWISNYDEWISTIYVAEQGCTNVASLGRSFGTSLVCSLFNLRATEAKDVHKMSCFGHFECDQNWKTRRSQNVLETECARRAGNNLRRNLCKSVWLP